MCTKDGARIAPDAIAAYSHLPEAKTVDVRSASLGLCVKGLSGPRQMTKAGDFMKHLSGLDSTFLYLETPETPMHVGGLNLDVDRIRNILATDARN